MPYDQKCIEELHNQLKKGEIQKGYKAILDYLLSLQSYLKKKYTEYSFPGTFYHGYLDMSYFAFVPPSLKEKGLKIAIVFNYDAFRFEIWLSGYNKEIQEKYWEYFKNKKAGEYIIHSSIKGYDSIVEDHITIDTIDTDKTTKTIENRIKEFIKAIEESLKNS